MRDWDVVIRERLSGEAVRGWSGDVAAELADHLEDSYEELRANGLCESEAVARVLDDIDWHGLARQMRKAKRSRHAINERTRQLWLPALVSLTLANTVLMVLTRISLGPRMIASLSTSWFPGISLMAGYLPWLTVQPVIGALGAYFSYRAGGSRMICLTAGLFPSIVMLGCWTCVIPPGVLFERHVWVMNHPAYLALGTFAWVVPAATGLFFGCLPFLCIGHREMAPRIHEP